MDEHPFATYFDVHQNYRVLSHSHIKKAYIYTYTYIYIYIYIYIMVTPPGNNYSVAVPRKQCKPRCMYMLCLIITIMIIVHIYIYIFIFILKKKKKHITLCLGPPVVPFSTLSWLGDSAPLPKSTKQKKVGYLILSSQIWRTQMSFYTAAEACDPQSCSLCQVGRTCPRCAQNCTLCTDATTCQQCKNGQYLTHTNWCDHAPRCEFVFRWVMLVLSCLVTVFCVCTCFVRLVVWLRRLLSQSFLVGRGWAFC